MIRGILFFIFIWVAVVVGITVFCAATNKERWSATKAGVFGFVTALIAVFFVTLIVVLF